MGHLIPTGVALFDQDLGGLRSGHSHLILGQKESGLSLLGLQFLLGGLHKGRPGLLVTSEQPEELRARAEDFGLKWPRSWPEDRLFIISHASLLSMSRLEGARRFRAEVLRPFASPSQGRLAVFDPIDPLFEPVQDLRVVCRDLDHLIRRQREWGWTTLFLHRPRPSESLDPLSTLYGPVSSAVFELKNRVDDEGAGRSLVVHKSYSGVPTGSEIPLLVLPGRGLVGGQAPPPPSRSDSGRAAPTRPRQPSGPRELARTLRVIRGSGGGSGGVSGDICGDVSPGASAHSGGTVPAGGTGHPLYKTVTSEGFYTLCEQVCAAAARGVNSVGVIRLRWEVTATGEGVGQVLLAALAPLLRPRDALTRGGAGEIMILLGAGDLRRTMVFLRALRGRIESGPFRDRLPSEPGILASFATYDSRHTETWTARRLIAEAREEARDLLRDSLFSAAGTGPTEPEPALTL